MTQTVRASCQNVNKPQESNKRGSISADQKCPSTTECGISLQVDFVTQIAMRTLATETILVNVCTAIIHRGNSLSEAIIFLTYLKADTTWDEFEKQITEIESVMKTTDGRRVRL